MKTLIKNIKQLVQVRDQNITKLKGKQMSYLPTLSNAWLLINEDKIENFGGMETLPNIEADQEIDATGKLVLPSWLDSHTHLVYAGHREQEFVDKINVRSPRKP